MGEKDSDPAPDGCVGCATRRDVRAWKGFARWFVPIGIGVVLTLGGGYLSLHFLARANAAEVSHLREGRTEDRAEVQRLAAEHRDLEKAAALEREQQAARWGRIEETLRSIDKRLSRLEERPTARRRAP